MVNIWVNLAESLEPFAISLPAFSNLCHVPSHASPWLFRSQLRRNDWCQLCWLHRVMAKIDLFALS